MIKEFLLRRISSGLIGALHTLQLKDKFDKTCFYTCFYKNLETEIQLFNPSK